MLNRFRCWWIRDTTCLMIWGVIDNVMGGLIDFDTASELCVA
jgi:hypothetical protein